MEKYGVVDQTLTSGPYKDAGSMLRDMRSAGDARSSRV